MPTVYMLQLCRDAEGRAARPPINLGRVTVYSSDLGPFLEAYREQEDLPVATLAHYTVRFTGDGIYIHGIVSDPRGGPEVCGLWLLNAAT